MKINETVRKDGLRIITCHVPQKKTVLVELIARVGYACDPINKPGLFHTLEHMVFEGTEKRTAKELSAFASKNFFGNNASTGTLATTYEVTTIDRKFPLACEYLCDIYFNATIPVPGLKKEKGPILLEIARKKDSDNSIGSMALNECLYKENPSRCDGVGTSAGIGRIHRADLIDQKNKWYIPSNTIALAVGNINHDDFVKEINKRIPLSLKKVSLCQWGDEANDPPVKKEMIIKKPKREKTMLFLGCKIPKNLDVRQEEAFSLFSKLIGRGFDSPLWHEIRERRGLAYSIQSNYSGIAGLSSRFIVYAETSQSKSSQVEKLIWQVLVKPLPDNGKFEELREKVFNAFEVDVIENNELDYFEGLIWKKIVDGDPVKMAEQEDKKRLKAIASLSLKDLEAVRKQFIRPERFAKVLIEPE